MSLGARLRELRLKKRESLQDVADAVKISKTHIWELETRRSQNPSIDILTKLADHFKVTVRSLIGEDPDTASAGDELQRMFRQVGKLEQHERDVLDDMIQSMLKRRRDRDDSD